MRDDVVMSVVVIGFIFAVVALCYLSSSYKCSVKAEKQELEYSYALFQGCMVKQGGKWIDYERLRYTD